MTAMRFGSCLRWLQFFLFSLLLAVPVPTSVVSAEDAPPPPQEPQIAGASQEGEQALASFQLPAGWKGALFAAEPLLANPVAFAIDGQGRVYVCETFRQSKGVEDNRGREYWLDDDLAAQTIADRVAYVKKHLKEKAAEFTRHDDRLRLLVDKDGDGKADTATVFAKHFNRISDGTGAGVLSYRGDVFYTNIPDLWRLRDTNGDGEADQRESLHYGYGVRYAFRGHDLHGLTVGPDGKIYFSCGDRGYNVTTGGKRWRNPECGAVFRCNPDGTDLEVFAYGLRNPQELAFDEFGNLFTGDNNSDSGDRARWVYVAEGGDTGWRMSYQYLPDRGPFNREKIWHPANADQPAYISPPITNLASGPSGLAYYPGVGLSEHFDGRFFLCDFRGGPKGSGIRTFRVVPKGAFFEVTDEELSLANVLATDVDFGPDGALYVSDWVDGWNGLGKGRVYRFFDPELVASKEVAEVKELLGANLAKRPASDLGKLLRHADKRVRQAAQFALVDVGAANELMEASAGETGEPADTLKRIHAIWGLGQLAAKGKLPSAAFQHLMLLLDDGDDEVRAQACKVLGESRHEPARDKLIERLNEGHPRVRYFAALALGKVGDASAIEPLLEMLAQNNDQDPMLRHAGIMGLAGIGGYRGWEDPSTEVSTANNAAPPSVSSNDRPTAREALVKSLKHPAPPARLGLAVALRRLHMPELAQLLDDADPRVVVEAARGIHDEPIPAALTALARLAGQELTNDALARRVLNANFRLGQAEHAQAIATAAMRPGASETIRLEAIDMLATWSRPAPKDRVLNIWRPLPARDGAPALAAYRRALPALVARPDKGGSEAARRAAELGIQEVGPMLHSLLADTTLGGPARADALRALATLKDGQLLDVTQRSTKDGEPAVRVAALDILVGLRPADAIPLLAQATRSEQMLDRQGAFATLARLKDPQVDEIVAASLDRLLAGDLPLDSRLDLLSAAGGRQADAVKTRLRKFFESRPTNDPLATYAEALAGGDTTRGGQIFFERAQVSCVRCHKVAGRGGDVGPDLTKIGAEKNAAYLLEAIVLPNKTIAKNFESVLVVDDEGRLHTGILKSEDNDKLQLMTNEGRLVTIPKASIEERRAAKSPMPEDLTKHLTPFDVRDLVAYLASLRDASSAPQGDK